MNSVLIPVPVGGGLVVWHTREDLKRYYRGVDRKAAIAANSKTPIEHGNCKCHAGCECKEEEE